MPVINRGDDFFQVVTYTGNGTSQTISGLRFQPDFVWIKGRSGATDHALYDAQRGVQKRLESNTTDAEASSDNGVTAFNSDGFSIGSLAQVNTNGATYVAWCWKEGATQGFDIVTFTGDGSSPKNIAHSLGVAPKMIIIKSRNNTSGWNSYHASLGNTQQINLQSTAAATSSVDWWNNTSPTSSQFTIGANININGWTFVACLFAAVSGYSAFGSYTGNGSTDGPFVFTGFRPRYILRKRTDTTAYWVVFDTARNTYNVVGEDLYPNDSLGGNNDFTMDILSNGFKIRGSGSNINASSGTYIYAAFAENPFKLSLAR